MKYAMNNNALLSIPCSLISIITIQYISSNYTKCDNTEHHSTANNKNSAASFIRNNEQSKTKLSYATLTSQFRNYWLGKKDDETIHSESLYPVELSDSTFMSRFNVDHGATTHVGAFTVSGMESTPRYFLLDGDFSSNKLVVKESKINQDRGCVVIPYADSNSALFAVFDGHGKIGHKVSQFVCEQMEQKIQTHPQFYTNVSTALKDTFLIVNEELKKAPFEYPMFSGTTAVVIVLRNDTLYVAAVGDSRAVLGERNNDKISCTSLTTDHKPDKACERKRIEECGGYVSAAPFPGYTARAWSCPERIGLGLAMSRSIGDFALKSTGVIATPEINTHPLQPNDQFVILASDGVWDFVSSQEAVDIVGNVIDNGGTASLACRELTKYAVNRWTEMSDDYRDDITVIVIKLNGLFS